MRLLQDEKWLLGFALAIIYIPLRTFLNVHHDLLSTALSKLPLFLIEILISTVFFSGWIFVIDWGMSQIKLVKAAGTSFKFKISNQLFLLIPAIFLAVVFNWFLTHVWGLMDDVWSPQEPIKSATALQLQSRAASWRANQALTIFAFVAAYYLCVSNQVQIQGKKLVLDAQKLENENLHARFISLKNQISPHFLFNNLSVLSSLVELRPEKSAEFIQQLSLTYRYILERAELHQISIKDELDFLETYSFLIKTRFGNKVEISIDIPAHIQNQHFIVPLTLQLLVENAVKHNAMSLKKPLIIMIYVQDKELVVSNKLQPKPDDESSTKVGLNNIDARYKLLLNTGITVLKASESFVVRIPLI